MRVTSLWPSSTGPVTGTLGDQGLRAQPGEAAAGEGRAVRQRDPASGEHAFSGRHLLGHELTGALQRRRLAEAVEDLLARCAAGRGGLRECLGTPEGQRFVAVARELLTAGPDVPPKVTGRLTAASTVTGRVDVPVEGATLSLTVGEGTFEVAVRGLSTFEKWGRAVSDVAGTIGRGVATAASAVWRGLLWAGGQLGGKVFATFGRILRWITKLPARVWRLLLGLWEGVQGLKPWSLTWWASLGQVTTWLGLLRWLGYRLVDLLEIAGVGEVYETLADFVKFNTRSLNAQEISTARRVFGGSIDLGAIRVDQSAVLGPAFSRRPYTGFHTVNSWGRLSPEVLVHELTHVWQYDRAGAIYMPQALHAQIWGAGYDYGGAAGLARAQAEGRGLMGFNREQQAQIVMDFAGLPPFHPDLALYASFVREVSTLTPAELIATRV
ncbi:hypothetical protein [Nonomuraea sp. NPDC002799]